MYLVQVLAFVLNGVSYPNGSTVLRTDIGEGDAALQCTTDCTTCYTNYFNSGMHAGQFYILDGTQVSISGSVTTPTLTTETEAVDSLHSTIGHIV